MTILKTDRFYLEPITEKHIQSIFEGLSNKKVTKHYAVHFDSLAHTKEQINWYKNLRNSNKGEWWAIHSKTNAIFQGAIGFNDFQKEKKQIEIGFWLLPKFWKLGVISECMPFIIDYAFSNFKIDHIIAFVESENYNSSRLLKRSHFKHLQIQVEEKNGRQIRLYSLVYSKVKQ